MIASLSREIVKVEAEIDALMARDDLAAQAQLLMSMPGLGPVGAVTLLSDLPELGTLCRRGISSLGGLAPIARDSGHRKGVRRIGKGRPVVRSALYITAMHATRRDETFMAKRQAFEKRGHTPKQAICAFARNQLVILNAMVKSGRAHDPDYAAKLLAS
ncbi:MAG: transposase [Pseudomonadota bacterium]